MSLRRCRRTGCNRRRYDEKIFFNHQSTGASNDIMRATELARKMITEWGFDDEIGPVCYSRSEGEIFLGREISKPREMSEKMAEKIDTAINNLIHNLNERAKKLLEENREKLVALAEALIEHEVLDREEVDRVIAGEKLESTKKSRQYQHILDLAEKLKKDNTPPPDPGNRNEPPPPIQTTETEETPVTAPTTKNVL